MLTLLFPPAGDVDKARSVAERALQTISYREEQEKLNVWVALINLENAYGRPDADEAATACFQKALQYTDQKKLYLAFLGILQRSGKDALAEPVRWVERHTFVHFFLAGQSFCIITQSCTVLLERAARKVSTTVHGSMRKPRCCTPQTNHAPFTAFRPCR